MNRVVVDTRVRHGKPVIAGTRVGIDSVLGALASGMTYAQVCKEYGIHLQDVRAALEYAREIILHEEIRPLRMVIR